MFNDHVQSTATERISYAPGVGYTHVFTISSRSFLSWRSSRADLGGGGADDHPACQLWRHAEQVQLAADLNVKCR